MAKFRSYCIVIHNVRPDCKPTVVQHVSGAKRSAVALEPYKNQSGFHIHIQIQYVNQRHFNAVLDEFNNLSKKICEIKPEGEDRGWGRVQVDQMRGTFEQATAYLVDPRKSKPVDGQVVIKDIVRSVDKFCHEPCIHGYKNLFGQIEDWLRDGNVAEKSGECPECRKLFDDRMYFLRLGFKKNMLSN